MESHSWSDGSEGAPVELKVDCAGYQSGIYVISLYQDPRAEHVRVAVAH